MNNMKTTIQKAFALVIIASLLQFINVSAFAQIERKGQADIKLSLNAYSFTKPLLDKVRGRGQGMSLKEFIDWSAAQGFDAVDLTGYFFPGYPQVPSDEVINDIKRYAFIQGL